MDLDYELAPLTCDNDDWCMPHKNFEQRPILLCPFVDGDVGVERDI